jgi:hypothetical protein
LIVAAPACRRRRHLKTHGDITTRTIDELRLSYQFAAGRTTFQAGISNRWFRRLEAHVSAATSQEPVAPEAPKKEPDPEPCTVAFETTPMTILRGEINGTNSAEEPRIEEPRIEEPRMEVTAGAGVHRIRPIR